jgi:hypothetical protein
MKLTKNLKDEIEAFMLRKKLEEEAEIQRKK